MKVFTIVALFCHSWLFVFGTETCKSVSEALETACEFPKTLTLVSVPNKYSVDGKNCDAEFNKGDWQQEPTVSFPDADPNKTYTLVNVDPDPPAYQKGEYWLHWLVSNIKGEDLAKGDLSKANHLTGYYGPNPPAGSGVHRYMFLAFEEKNKGSGLEVPKTRAKFQLGPWLERQEKLCGPVAGIQFRTQF